MRLAVLIAAVALSGLAVPAAGHAPNKRSHHGNTGISTTGLFVSPAGIVYRPADGAPIPLQAWFAAVDTNHDGVVDWAEFHADFMHAFDTLDANHNGEIGPDEINQYESTIFPEMAAMDSGAMGYGLVPLSHPLMSADRDLNRGISRAEWERAAIDRWTMMTDGRSQRLSMADINALRSAQAHQERERTVTQTQSPDTGSVDPAVNPPH